MNNPVLLLIHGFPLDARMWSAQADALLDIRNVMTPDLPGHGANRSAPLESVGAMAEWLRDQLDDAGVEAVDLAGFSMGGYVAFEFWRRYPRRVRSLSLVDTRASAETDAGRAGRDDARAAVRERGVGVIADSMLPRLLTDNAPVGQRDAVHRWMLESRPETVLADLLALRDRPESISSLKTIDVPSLVVVGERDQVTPPADAEQIAGGIPGATLAVVPGAAHLAPVEQATLVSEALRAHLLAART